MAAGDAIPLHLYLCPLNLPGLSGEQQARLLDTLPVDEQLKVTRYRMASAREKGLLVRCYLRALLSQAHGLLRQSQLNADPNGAIAPSEWCFDYLDKGKPVLTEPFFTRSQLVFNLSHSGDYMLLAIAQAPQLELGVDIERLRVNTNIHAILNHYFTHQERDALLALPSARQRQRFFDLWALKESYIKAKGMGLALSLKSFYFELSDSEPRTMNFKGLDARQARLEQVARLFLVEEDSKHEASEQESPGEQQIQPAAGWQSMLGQLDDEYRFALSLSSVKPIDWRCELVDPQTLFAD
ncbi:4'-phosphopantetheinyl transferase superfamily protein [Shewanella sp. JBTF-M18]|uniref:4'-phosphopantetheinyl transferase superfamily protein n=1 Tax=Shewanella insulae TaxID=2681496 RepID=A0A6L7HW55_9GAMM|nr:4'-phosphopantetheinyl transferase superfamily protein [Shewanella insulae]MXR68250.1 4'-phosphopantetheinyl transferase superfamily protein [Shewanella insulae]